MEQREIKFRAWDKRDKVMYCGVEKGIDFDDRSHYEFKNFLGYQKKEDYHEWELMQYTGLKNKNGKEIYEGDIVSLYKESFIVKFNEGEFVGDNSDFTEGILSASELKDSEVIGNIYENKELLKENK